MAYPEIYQYELEKFKKAYNLDKYDLDQFQNLDNGLRYMDEFLNISPASNTSASQFVSWAGRTLAMYFEANTKLTQDGPYLPAFDARKFLIAFENLAKAKYLSTLEEGQDPASRKRYGGAEEHEVNLMLNKVAASYDIPLPTMWKDRLREGSMNVADMQAATDSACQAMEDNTSDKDTVQDDLNKVAAAYEAMKQLRATRKGFLAWFWKLFNRTQNNQEKAYLGRLETQVRQLETWGYDVTKAARSFAKDSVITKAIMKGAGMDVLQAEVKAQPDNVINNNDVKESEQVVQPNEIQPPKEEAPSVVEDEVKSTNFKPVAKKISKGFTDELMEKIVDELDSKIPANGIITSQRRTTFELMIVTPAFEEVIGDLNQQFDNAIQNGGDLKMEMAKLVRDVFKKATEYSGMCTRGTPFQRAGTCEILARVLIENLTPAAYYPELKTLANEYLKNNVELYKQITKGAKLYYKEAVDDYAVDYVPNANDFEKSSSNANQIEDDDESLFNYGDDRSVSDDNDDRSFSNDEDDKDMENDREKVFPSSFIEESVEEVDVEVSLPSFPSSKNNERNMNNHK